MWFFTEFQRFFEKGQKKGGSQRRQNWKSNPPGSHTPSILLRKILVATLGPSFSFCLRPTIFECIFASKLVFIIFSFLTLMNQKINIYDFLSVLREGMIIGYGAEKDIRLHRADTGTPVRRKNTERSVEGSPAVLCIFQREYPIIIIYNVLLKTQKNRYIYFHGGICFYIYNRVSECGGAGPCCTFPKN